MASFTIVMSEVNALGHHIHGLLYIILISWYLNHKPTYSLWKAPQLGHIRFPFHIESPMTGGRRVMDTRVGDY